MSLSEDIKQKGLELGFDLVGITDASPIDAEQIEFLALSFWPQLNPVEHKLVPIMDYGRNFRNITKK
jgi:hypothetical protein